MSHISPQIFSSASSGSNYHLNVRVSPNRVTAGLSSETEVAELSGGPCVLRDESFLLAPHRASCSVSSRAAHLASPEAREWTQQWLLEEGFEEGLGLEP